MSAEGGGSSREYTCARCGGVYEKTWTDEEAEHEKTALFGRVPLSACVVVCDPCFQGFMRTCRRQAGGE